MIKHTQKNLFNNRYVCTNRSSGVSCPDFSKIAHGFNFKYYAIKTWEDYENYINDFLSGNDAAICEVFIDPEQSFYPKVSTHIKSDGTLTSLPLEDMSPLISRQQLKEDMIIDLLEASKVILEHS